MESSLSSFSSSLTSSTPSSCPSVSASASASASSFQRVDQKESWKGRVTICSKMRFVHISSRLLHFAVSIALLPNPTSALVVVPTTMPTRTANTYRSINLPLTTSTCKTSLRTSTSTSTRTSKRTSTSTSTSNLYSLSPQRKGENPQKEGFIEGSNHGLPLLFSSKSSVVIADNNEFGRQRSRLSKIERLRQISNWASFLCVLDCTVLPIVTVLLPLLGFLPMAAAADTAKALHTLGHSLALWFVLPVGSTTTIINYASHKKQWLALLSILGLVCVALTNAPTIIIHSHYYFLHSFLECLHHGPWHRVINVLGCILLLGSNHVSQRLAGGGGIGGVGCDCGLPHDNTLLQSNTTLLSSSKPTTNDTTGNVGTNPMMVQSKLIQWKKTNGIS